MTSMIYPGPAPKRSNEPRAPRQREAGLGAGWPPRIINLVASLAYLLLFFLTYQSYLSVEWGYTGLLYRAMTNGEWAFVIAAVSVTALMLPPRLASPSAIIIWMLCIFVQVPTLLITFMIGERPSADYMPALGAMTAIVCLASFLSSRNSHLIRDEDPTPDPKFIVISTMVFGAASVILYYQFSEILSFSALDDVYYQRFVASEIGGGLIGYLRTHYAYVFSPVMIAIGLSKRGYRFLVPVGIIGSILTYMIDASKIVLIVPIVVIAFHIIGSYRNYRTYVFTGGIAFLTAICSVLTSQLSIIKILADLVLLRSIAIPAQTFAQYADLFSMRGYTWWSNVRGINLFVPPPSAYASDPRWPVLGQIVGAEFYGFDSRMNANANLFVGEGVAAGGAVGVLVIGLFFVAWIQALDRAARGWNRHFVVLISVSMGLALTNTHLSTLLLSFGGFLWLIVLAFYKPKSVLGGMASGSTSQ